VARKFEFDCIEGFDDWLYGWSRAKQEWCCRNRDRGCPPTTAHQQPSRAGYAPCTTSACNHVEGWTGTEVCEGHDYSLSACESVGCCRFDMRTALCYSAVANGACQSAPARSVPQAPVQSRSPTPLAVKSVQYRNASAGPRRGGGEGPGGSGTVLPNTVYGWNPALAQLGINQPGTSRTARTPKTG